jgi:hypothetical protein
MSVMSGREDLPANPGVKLTYDDSLQLTAD